MYVGQLWIQIKATFYWKIMGSCETSSVQAYSLQNVVEHTWCLSNKCIQGLVTKHDIRWHAILSSVKNLVWSRVSPRVSRVYNWQEAIFLSMETCYALFWGWCQQLFIDCFIQQAAWLWMFGAEIHKATLKMPDSNDLWSNLPNLGLSSTTVESWCVSWL